MPVVSDSSQSSADGPSDEGRWADDFVVGLDGKPGSTASLAIDWNVATCSGSG
ncbi:MAG: hypothetical protein IBJ12_07855 [Sphingomonadaceae bacterium]|nr:hypothetical protein [Sphingomonadaceae bacterium]